jgi:transcriptional regulator with XRE-family HTH domain
MTLGARIRQSRRARGMSQLALSRLVDISNNAMHKIEVGQTPDPRLSHVRKVAEALDVSLEYLAGLTDDPTPYGRGDAPMRGLDPLPPRSLMHRLLTTP